MGGRQIGFGETWRVAACLLGLGGSAATAAEAQLVIDGLTTGPRTFSIEQLTGLPQQEAKRTDHGRPISCKGVALIDLLAVAGLPVGDAVRGPALTTVIVATGRDGYRAAFTLGELDRKLGNTTALLATSCSGTGSSDRVGELRLILPADQRGARSVRQLERLTITMPAAL